MQTVSEDAVDTALSIMKVNKLYNTKPLSKGASPLQPSDRKYFRPKKQHEQHNFWLSQQVRRGTHEALILYVLCCALPIIIPTSAPKRISETEQPSKRQRTDTRKCGHCREAGHTVRQCTKPGIEEYREKTKAVKAKKIAKALGIPAPVPLPAGALH